MWILVLMTIVNAVLHQQGVQNTYRVSFGIVQIGIIELVMALGFLYALVFGGGVRGRFPVMRSHPIVVWILTLLFVGGFFGLMMGVVNGNSPKDLLVSAREFLAFPACLIVGYRLLGTPQAVRSAARLVIIAGFFTATALFYSFGETTETASITGSLGTVRGIITFYQSEYAAVTALVLVYVVMTRFPLWRTWICIAVGVYCYIGYATTLSRVGFLILFFGTAAAYLLLPQGERMRKFLRSVVFVPILFFACWGALWGADQIIGRNFSGKVLDHIMTLMPGERTGRNEKAWDSRLSGIAAELIIWSKNPLMGQGFGTGNTAATEGQFASGVAFKHNAWTSVLSETGIFGFAGLLIMVSAMTLIGFRMVHDRTNFNYMLMGAVGFFTGLVFLMRCTATFAITSRAAIQFGLVAGLLLRARELQETEIAHAQQAAAWDVYIDEHTGLLVPDYSLDLGHFGTTVR